MNFLKNLLTTTVKVRLLTFVLVAVPCAVQAAEETSETTGRTAAIETEGVVAAIDQQTREVSLRTVGGFIFTVVAPETAISLDDVSVGDRVAGTYTMSIEADLREPTEEELADPWTVLEEAVVTKDGDEVSVDKAQVVRAVVTVDGMQKENGIVVVTDSRGMVHFISDVESVKLADVKIGQKVVITFAQAMALTLEKK